MGSFWIGFWFGFLGLGIYFRTWADFIIPVSLTFLFSLPVVTIVLVPLFVGVYGYFRASCSNKNNGYK